MDRCTTTGNKKLLPGSPYTHAGNTKATTNQERHDSIPGRVETGGEKVKKKKEEKTFLPDWNTSRYENEHSISELKTTRTWKLYPVGL